MNSGFLWALIVYLLFSLVLSEGLIYHGKKTGKGTGKLEYFLILLLGPLTLIIVIVANMLGRKPK